ncbi:MAG: hypothetical protein K0U20_09320 [Proteobacteria bacterium]|nr:hypothetical protein [Pseudomonadota bacterium]MCH9735780.1 hypothetical protein [Actinomycetes bacterium]
MFGGNLKTVLAKVSKFVEELENGIEKNNGVVLGKKDEIQVLETEIALVNAETATANKLLAKLK